MHTILHHLFSQKSWTNNVMLKFWFGFVSSVINCYCFFSAQITWHEHNIKIPSRLESLMEWKATILLLFRPWSKRSQWWCQYRQRPYFVLSSALLLLNFNHSWITDQVITVTDPTFCMHEWSKTGFWNFPALSFWKTHKSWHGNLCLLYNPLLCK